MDAFQTNLLVKCPFFLARTVVTFEGKQYCVLMCMKHTSRWYPRGDEPGKYEKHCCGCYKECNNSKLLEATYK